MTGDFSILYILAIFRDCGPLKNLTSIYLFSYSMQVLAYFCGLRFHWQPNFLVLFLYLFYASGAPTHSCWWGCRKWKMLSQTRPPVAFRWEKVVSSDTKNVFWIWCFLWDPLADVPHLHLLLGGGEALSHLTMKDSAFIISRASSWYPLLLLLSLSGWDYWLVQGRNEPTWVTLWCFIGKQWTWVTFFC